MAHANCWSFLTRWFNRPRTCRLAVVGEKGSGKTSLIYRFSRDRMPSAGAESATVLDTDEMDVVRNGKTIRLVVHDTSSEEDYVKVRALTYNDVDGVILCFPLDLPEALDRLRSEWGPELKHLCRGKPRLLVGTKKDLQNTGSSRGSQNNNMFITKKQGKQLARSIGAVGYLECSALNGDNVKRVFGRIIMKSLQQL